MELNAFTALLVLMLVAYMSYTRGKMLYEHKKGLQQVVNHDKLEKIFTGKIYLLIYSLALIASIVGLVYMFKNRFIYENFDTWILVFLVIMITSITDIIRTFILYTTYYNEQGLYHNDQFIRYNSIKNFKVKKIPITTEVYLFNNTMHVIPTKALQKLEHKIKAIKK